MLVSQPEMSKFVIYDQYGQQSLITLPSQATFMVQNSVQGNVLLAPVGGMQLNLSYQQVQSVSSGYVAPPKGHDSTALFRKPEDVNAPVLSVPNSDDIANGSNPLPVLNPKDANDDGSGVRNTPPPVAENNINIKDEVHPVGKPEDAPVPSVPNSDKIANGSNDPPKGNGDGSSLSNAPPPPPVAENNINDEVHPVGKPQDAPVPCVPNPDEIANGSNDPPKGNGDGSGLSNAPPPVAENNINDEVCPVGKPQDAPVPSVPKALDLSGENKDLVPLNKPLANGEGSKGSDTEEYSKIDEK